MTWRRRPRYQREISLHSTNPEWRYARSREKVPWVSVDRSLTEKSRPTVEAVAAAYLTPPVVLPWFADGLINLGMQLIGILIVGAVLALLGRRGPLETLLGWASMSRR